MLLKQLRLMQDFFIWDGGKPLCPTSSLVNTSSPGSLSTAFFRCCIKGFYAFILFWRATDQCWPGLYSNMHHATVQPAMKSLLVSHYTQQYAHISKSTQYRSIYPTRFIYTYHKQNAWFFIGSQVHWPHKSLDYYYALLGIISKDGSIWKWPPHWIYNDVHVYIFHK